MVQSWHNIYVSSYSESWELFINQIILTNYIIIIIIVLSYAGHFVPTPLCNIIPSLHWETTPTGKFRRTYYQVKFTRLEEDFFLQTNCWPCGFDEGVEPAGVFVEAVDNGCCVAGVESFPAPIFSTCLLSSVILQYHWLSYCALNSKWHYLDKTLCSLDQLQ